MDRENLHMIFKEMGFKIGAEIGVGKGENALNMFKRLPGLKLYMVDSWEGRNKPLYKRVVKRMKPYGHNAMVIRKPSEDVAPLIMNESLDFVYIDGDHRYDMVMLDIILWGRKVRPGGIVSGHDYRRHRKLGVKYAVDDYARYHKLDLRRSGRVDWYWIK